MMKMNSLDFKLDVWIEEKLKLPRAETPEQ